MTPNQRAFLDMIAHSEIGQALLAVSDNGYNVIVGSTPEKPILFYDYSQHPHRYVKRMNSTAAGRYQILARYADAYIEMLHLPDFGPTSQDVIALQMIRECRAIPLIEAGSFDAAVKACASRWASFPGAGYGQHENKLDELRAAYQQAGGTLA